MLQPLKQRQILCHTRSKGVATSFLGLFPFFFLGTRLRVELVLTVLYVFFHLIRLFIAAITTCLTLLSWGPAQFSIFILQILFVSSLLFILLYFPTISLFQEEFIPQLNSSADSIIEYTHEKDVSIFSRIEAQFFKRYGTQCITVILQYLCHYWKFFKKEYKWIDLTARIRQIYWTRIPRCKDLNPIR